MNSIAQRLLSEWTRQMDGGNRALSVLREAADEIERLENLNVNDWRIGLSVTPKMRTHYWFRHLAVIRKVHQASDGMQEMIDVEIYHGDSGETTILREPSEEWMTA